MQKTTIAALIALFAVAAPATAAEAEIPQHKVALDRSTTGSVGDAARITGCDPKSPTADIVCKINRGQSDVNYPPAPNFMFSGY